MDTPENCNMINNKSGVIHRIVDTYFRVERRNHPEPTGEKDEIKYYTSTCGCRFTDCDPRVKDPVSCGACKRIILRGKMLEEVCKQH